MAAFGSLYRLRKLTNLAFIVFLSNLKEFNQTAPRFVGPHSVISNKLR